MSETLNLDETEIQVINSLKRTVTERDLHRGGQRVYEYSPIESRKTSTDVNLQL